MAAVPASSTSSTTARLFQLAWPISLEMLLSISLVWVDSAIINHRLGTEAFTSVQLAGQIFNLLGLALNIVATGVAIVVAHQVGAGDRAGAGRTAAQSLGAGILVSLALLLVILTGMPFFLGLLGATGSVLTGGLHFAHLMASFLPVTWLITGLGAVMRATGDTRRPMYVAVLINLLNAAFTYTLVFGFDLGITGSALGTSFARLVGLVVLALLFLRAQPVSFRLGDLYRFDKQTLWRVARMGLPGAAESISYQASQFVLTMIVAPLGTVALASRSLTFQAEAFTYIPSVGLAQAASILVGQAIGAADRERAVATGKAAIRFGLLFTGALAVVLFLFPDVVLKVFTVDPAVLALARITLRIASAYKLGQCLNLVCGGIFRGAGNPEWPTLLTTLGTWLLTVPLAFVGVKVGWGLPGVVLAMFTDEMIRGGMNLWYFTTPRWRFRRI
jgi:putative MATE family efflux protein